MHFEKSQRPQQGPFRESDVSQYACRLVIKRMHVFFEILKKRHFYKLILFDVRKKLNSKNALQ